MIVLSRKSMTKIIIHFISVIIILIVIINILKQQQIEETVATVYDENIVILDPRSRVSR